MKNSDISHNIPHTDWQMLDELKLPIGSSIDAMIHTWLSAALEPLELHAQFLDKIMKAAQDAAGRAMRSDRAMEFRHLHFLVHISKQPASNKQTWGFFQIEKMGDSTPSGNPHEHAIEFYLYMEG